MSSYYRRNLHINIRRHKVKLFNWDDGLLNTVVYVYNSLEDAMSALERMLFSTAKIYDEEDRMVHERVGKKHNHHHHIPPHHDHHDHDDHHNPYC